LAAVALAGPGPVIAFGIFTEGWSGAPPGFYEDRARGWWWYEREPEPVPEFEAPEEPSPTQEPPAPAAGAADASVSSESPPPPLSPPWLRTKLPEFRDRALADPSPENVAAFFYLQRYAMDLAERFAQVAQRVVLADPLLDMNARRPLSTYGAQAHDRAALARTEALAREVAGIAGIWYVYRSDCPYCAQQSPVLERVGKRLGIAILPLALDGRPLPDGAFPAFVADRGHAQRLGVEVTPSLFLARPPDQFVRLANGLITDQELIERIVAAAHAAGWISDAAFAATRATRPRHMVPDETPLPADALDDPATLIEHLRSRVVEESL
jgi:conjugal transfer pilus assembly protein TraF